MSCSCTTCKCGSTQVMIGQKGDQGTKGDTGSSGIALTPVIDAIGASQGLTAGATGSLIMLDRSAGVATTLPTAPPIGTNYSFQIATAPSTGNDTITIVDGVSSFIGSVTSKEAGATDVLYSSATTSTITLNGGTQGGLSGTNLTVTYVKANTWNVSGLIVASGSRATPFS